MKILTRASSAILLALSAGSALTAMDAPAPNTWTNTSGVTIRGEFQRIVTDTLVIRKDDKELKIPLATLSPASRDQALRVVITPDNGPAPTGVTTTTLPDPFPNCAPRVTDREAVIETGKPGRTPSVLFGQYDVELDPLAVESFTQPAHGKTTRNADGTFNYESLDGFTGDDSFTFTLNDGRGGKGTATMRLHVIKPGGQWASTCFLGLTEVTAGGKPIGDGKSCLTPRVVDWNGDGKPDLLVGEHGGVTFYQNIGTVKAPEFAPGVRLAAGGQPLEFACARVSIAVVDFDHDGVLDLIVTPSSDRKPRWLRRVNGELAAPVILKTTDGADLVAADIRCEMADWNGDGMADLLTGTGSGEVMICYQNANRTFAPPIAKLDGENRGISGSYNINIRVTDINLDSIPDLVDSYNWGNINFHINTGSTKRPAIPSAGQFAVAAVGGAALDLHQLTNGPIVDFADLNGDGATDLVMGGEGGGRIRLAYGRSGANCLPDLARVLAAHPKDLGTYLADKANEAAKSEMQTLMATLYDYVTGFATPSQKLQLRDDLAKIITTHPQYLKRQKLDLKQQPGIPSLAAQLWLTMLMTGPDEPAVRRQVADAAGFTGGYRRLLEDIGVIYIENNENPYGAEAIWQWMRTIPREVYPGTGITAADWLGGKVFLMRGHLKNTFNGKPVDGGEYAFGPDARPVIGDRGSENWFMTVVHHEVSHDVDAYVRRHPELDRRWHQMLLLAGGPDMRADPATGGVSWDLTRQHFKDAGLWDGDPTHWDAALKGFWENGPGKPWREFGLMRGGIDWFLVSPQESLATQGNQHWNSTEGRIQVAIDRFNKGYTSDLTEVLFFLDIWSVGLNKVRFCENDNANNQVFRYAQVRRTAKSHIDRIDFGNGYSYEFKVDDKGVTTGLVHVPSPAAAPGLPQGK